MPDIGIEGARPSIARHPRRPRESAFTLVELLVVVAIIGVLSATVLSAVSRANDKARTLRCKNNLRKIGIALQMYVGDNNTIYPNYSAPDGTPWETALQPYYPVKWSNQLSQCPSYTGLLPADASITGPGGGRISSYGYNTWGVTWQPVNNSIVNYCLGLGVDAVRVMDDLAAKNGDSISAPLNHRESQVVSPSDFFAFMDARGSPTTVSTGNSVAHGWAGWDHTDGVPVADNNYPFLQSTPLHGDYLNILFCDSHVAAAKVTSLFEAVPSPGAGAGPTPAWACARNWNIDNQPHVEDWLYNGQGSSTAAIATRRRH